MADTVNIPVASLSVGAKIPTITGRANVANKVTPEMLEYTGDYPSGYTYEEWDTDTVIYHTAPSSRVAGATLHVEGSAIVTAHAAHFEVKCEVETTISMWVKTKSAAKRSSFYYGSYYDFGCVFGVTVDDLTTLHAYLGGWSDWTEVSVILDVGTHDIGFIFADFPIAFLEASLGETIPWPAVPEGEEGTNECWVDDISFSPTVYSSAKLIIKALVPVCTFSILTYDIPVGTLTLAALASGFFRGKVWPVVSASLGSIATKIPSVKGTISIAATVIETAITVWENLYGTPATQWEASTVYDIYRRGNTSDGTVDGIKFSGTWPVAGTLEFDMYFCGGYDPSARVQFDYFRLGEMIDEVFVTIGEWDMDNQWGVWTGPTSLADFRHFSIPVAQGTHTYQFRFGHLDASTAYIDWVIINDFKLRYIDSGDVTKLALVVNNPSYIWEVSDDNQYKIQEVYTCTLTGSEDGEDDLLLPMSSFQSRQRNGDPSYLEVVIPNAPAYEAGISARKNGDLVVKKGWKSGEDSFEQMEEICRAGFNSLRTDDGSLNSSATIVGYRTFSATAIKSRTVLNCSYRVLQANGTRRFRAPVDLFLRPGDTAVIGEESITVDYLTYIVSPLKSYMEITEAEAE